MEFSVIKTEIQCYLVMTATGIVGIPWNLCEAKSLGLFVLHQGPLLCILFSCLCWKPSRCCGVMAYKSLTSTVILKVQVWIFLLRWKGQWEKQPLLYRSDLKGSRELATLCITGARNSSSKPAYRLLDSLQFCGCFCFLLYHRCFIVIVSLVRNIGCFENEVIKL